MPERSGSDTLQDDALDATFLKRMARVSLTQRGRVLSYFGGRHRAFGVGQGVEFADHRPYQRGDDLRHVDWKAYGRSGRMLLRKYEPQGRADIAILIDCSASMGLHHGNKFTMAKRLAALLTHGALLQGDQVTLWELHEGQLHGSRVFQNPYEQNDAFNFLRGLRAEGKTNLPGAALAFARQYHKRAIAVLISDLVDARCTTAIEQLQATCQQCHVLHLCAPEEAHGVDTGAVELIDSESGVRLRALITDQVLARYRSEYEANLQHIARHVRKRGVPYARLSTADTIERAVVAMRRAHVVAA